MTNARTEKRKPRDLFILQEGLGDAVAFTALCEPYFRRFGEKVLVAHKCPEIFEGNPFCEVLPGIHQDSIDPGKLELLRANGFNPVFLTYCDYPFNPALSCSEIVYRRRHMIETMGARIGLSGKIASSPRIFLTQEEAKAGRRSEKPQIVLLAQGKTEWKTVPAAVLRQVCERLLEDGRFEAIQIGLAGDELISERVMDLRGKTTVREAAAILANSALFIGPLGFNCHLARAARCRSVVLLPQSEPPELAAYQGDEAVFSETQCDLCRKDNLMLRGEQCPNGFACIRTMSADRVVDAARRLLGAGPLPAEADVWDFGNGGETVRDMSLYEAMRKTLTPRLELFRAMPDEPFSEKNLISIPIHPRGAVCECAFRFRDDGSARRFRLDFNPEPGQAFLIRELDFLSGGATVQSLKNADSFAFTNLATRTTPGGLLIFPADHDPQIHVKPLLRADSVKIRFDVLEPAAATRALSDVFSVMDQGKRRAEEAESALKSIENSTIWKTSAPLRKFLDAWKGAWRARGDGSATSRTPLRSRLRAGLRFAFRCAIKAARMLRIPKLVKPFVPGFLWERWRERLGVAKPLREAAADVLSPECGVLKALRAPDFDSGGASRPLVTVIVPNYNHAAFLPQRLESVFRQTYSNFEVLLMDDCSTDDSRAVLTRWRDLHPDRTTLLFNDANSGSPFAQWKKGIEHAKGSLIWIAESDDWCEPDFLEKLVPEFDNELVMLAFGRSDFLLDGKRIWTSEEYLSDIAPDAFRRSFRMTAHDCVRTMFAKKNIIPNVSSCVFRNPGDMKLFRDPDWNRMRVCGDWIFYLHLIRGGAVAYRADAVNFYRQHAKNTSVATQKNDLYYVEHRAVAECVAENYRVPAETFAEQEAILLRFWREKRPADDPARLRELFPVEEIRKKQRERSLNIVMCAFAFSTGGGETVPIALANGLKEKGHAVTFVDCGGLPETNPEAKAKLSPRIPLLSLHWDWEEWPKLMEALGADVIHTHHACVDLAASKLSARNAVHVVTMHGMYEAHLSDEELRQCMPLEKREVALWLYIADKNLPALTDYAKKIPYRAVKIFNSLPPRPTRPPSRAELGVPDDAFLICVASRAIPEKGWEEAIRAVLDANERSTRDIRLILCGDGPECERLQSFASERIKFMGFQKHPADFFAAADVGMLPSRFAGECFPLVILESFMAGRPVIASDIGEIRSMLTEPNPNDPAGIVLPLRGGEIDHEALVAAVLTLAESPETLRAMSANAKKAAERFSFPVWISRHEELYRECLATTSRRTNELPTEKG